MKYGKNLIKFFNLRNAVVVLFATLIVAGCGTTSTGELIGVQGRFNVEQQTPFGTVYIPPGSYTRGTGGQDPTYQVMTAKKISITAFYMDETEITNNEYRQFVEYVQDSIMRRMLGETFPEFLVQTENDDAEPSINWKTKIKWTPELEEAVVDLYLPFEERFNGVKEIDKRRLNYAYYTFAFQNAATKNFEKQEEPAGNSEVYYSSFLNRPQAMQSRRQFITKHVVNVYPDTLCWIFDWSYSYNDPMAMLYFSSPMYDNYPVVGVNWVQANAFCNWRTEMYNKYMKASGFPEAQRFRLPNEAEWEYAARGGLDGAPYPWGGLYARNENGCVLGNFKPGRGDYALDGSPYPCIVGHFAPNDWGLYDMMGNVAEWCYDAYDESISNLHDLNPVFEYNVKEGDGPGRHRKVTKGGSWKDFSELCKVYFRGYEYQDTCKSYVGFRCVQSYLGVGRNIGGGSGSNVY
jgi:formylglycine-generating enzyme required for sulfatase activity